MQSVLLNRKKLQEALNALPDGVDLRLTIRKIKNPKPHGATHIVCLKNQPGHEENRKYKVIGSCIKETKAVKAAGEMDFFMLYAEGGGTPTVKYTNLAEPQNQAEHLRDKLGKKIFILRPVQMLEEPAVSNAALDATANVVEEEYREEDTVEPKKVRKRVPVKAQKLTHNNK